jgi:hypothetical protein
MPIPTKQPEYLVRAFGEDGNNEIVREPNKMRLKVGDVVMQTCNNSIWVMERETSSRTLFARCVYGGSSWHVGDDCPFSASPPDSGVIYLGTDPNIDIDVALAIAALIGAYA